MTTKTFQKIVWDYYRKYGRDLAWRKTRDPYRIVVSEIMLQQTQVDRVIPYYARFIKKFPTFQALRRASTQSVLLAWQGLGYNRRALNLQKLAQIVTEKYGGKLPNTVEELDELPGIGAGTAGSISAFAFNKPVPFIETNIRRVFIYHFFLGKKKVRDEEILELVKKTIDQRRPREWYYALMDYGSHLGKKIKNPNRKSAHYSRQSKFEGSDRQLRGRLLGEFLISGSINIKKFALGYKQPLIRIKRIMKALETEGFLQT